MKYFKKNLFLALTAATFFLIVSLFKINVLPGEWFGDISNVHEYEMQVLSGKWPFYFFQSPGPLYHYLIAPVVLLYRNHGFETYKTASIVVSLVGLIGTFLFVTEISSAGLALLTTLTMSFSFWYLIWSRLGNSQIVIPALVSFMSFFIARYVKKSRLSDLLIGAFFASLGWYTYPQSFIFPAVFLLFVIFFLLYKKKLTSQIRPLVIIVTALVVMAVPFVNIIRNDKGNFGPHGYVGGKLLMKSNSQHLISRTFQNFGKTLLMLHIEGDKTFRVNVSKNPQLDTLSGIFFLLGFIYFYQKKKKIWLFYIIWMLLVLPLPSISPAIPDAEIPSSSRTIAMIPFVYLLVGGGILWSYSFLFNNHNRYKNYKYLAGVIFAAIYGYLVFTNLKLYFTDYANGLPDRNSAPGKIIANYIDSLPKDVNVYFGSCCWGAWGHPEPKAVAYILRKSRDFIEYNHYLDSCREVTRLPAVVIFGPDDEKKIGEYKSCFPEAESEEIRSPNNIIIFRKMILNK